MHAQAPDVGAVDHMTDRPAEQDTRSYSDRVNGAKYELTRINKSNADVAILIITVDQLMAFLILTA